MKLKAFTITELMVVSVLGTICAGAVFTGFEVIQQQYFSYEKETAQMLALGELERQLETDVMDAYRITREPKGLKMEMVDYAIFYTFQADKIFRSSSIAGHRKKEFPFPVKNIRSHFELEAIDIGLLDFIEIEVEVEALPVVFALHKMYSAKQKMQFKKGQ